MKRYALYISVMMMVPSSPMDDAAKCVMCNNFSVEYKNLCKASLAAYVTKRFLTGVAIVDASQWDI